jgi:hypothetical protein
MLRLDRTVFLLVVTSLLTALLGALPLATVRAAAAVPTFHHLDRNGDGFLDRKEARALRDFARLDANADGRVDQVEFARW